MVKLGHCRQFRPIFVLASFLFQVALVVFLDGDGSNPYTTTSVQAFAVSVSRANSAKQKLLDSLDDPLGFNSATQERTALVKALTLENPTPQPGSVTGFAPVAVGTWKIVYAPHISTMGSLAGGSFDPVLYKMGPNGIMTSHARYTLPLLGSGWLSVSGTYGSEDGNLVCRVDFDKAWVTPGGEMSDDNVTDPVESFDSVPESVSKSLVQMMGQLGFAKSVSVFPVSYLDDDTVVFDFEFLGTRICARKVGNG